jgi:hypothetical protein
MWGEAQGWLESARQGDVASLELLFKFVGMSLDAAKGRAPYESPRPAAVAVREQQDEGRVITGESARERLLQVVLAAIAADDAAAAAAAPLRSRRKPSLSRPRPSPMMVMAVWHSVRRLTEIDEGYGLMRRRDGEWSVARSLRVEACLHEGMVSGAWPSRRGMPA